MREMRAIAFVTRLIEDGGLKDPRVKRMRIHAIEAEEVMQKLSAASKLNADWEFLLYLHAIGSKHATAWLSGDFEGVGLGRVDGFDDDEAESECDEGSEVLVR